MPTWQPLHKLNAGWSHTASSAAYSRVMSTLSYCSRESVRMIPVPKGDMSKLCSRCDAENEVFEQAGLLLSACPETLMAVS